LRWTDRDDFRRSVLQDVEDDDHARRAAQSLLVNEWNVVESELLVARSTAQRKLNISKWTLSGGTGLQLIIVVFAIISKLVILNFIESLGAYIEVALDEHDLLVLLDQFFSWLALKDSLQLFLRFHCQNTVILDDLQLALSASSLLLDVLYCKEKHGMLLTFFKLIHDELQILGDF